MWQPPHQHPLSRLFAGLTEHAFQSALGVADPPLIDYLSQLLSRFVHRDTIFYLKNSHGERLEQVADLLAEAQALPPTGRTTREIHRHIGDFALFWTGVYPEALQHLRSALRRDHFLDYCAQGKRAYFIASTFEADDFKDEAPVLRRLSDQFELCAYGLGQVRREWEQFHPGPDAAGRIIGC